jgi:hypothetical protein
VNQFHCKNILSLVLVPGKVNTNGRFAKYNEEFLFQDDLIRAEKEI